MKTAIIKSIFIIALIFLSTLFSINLANASSIPPYIAKGPHPGALDIFYSSDMAIDYATYYKGYINVPIGLQYVSFSGYQININWQGILSSLSSSPVVKLDVNFPQKLIIKGDRFIKLNVTVELSYNLPSESYLKVIFQDGDYRIIQGSGSTSIVKDYTSIAPQGDANLSIELHLNGPISSLLSAFVQIKSIYESAQRSFGVATKHEMYFSDDYKTIYHFVDLPVRYYTQGFDTVYLKIEYPVAYNLLNATVDNNPYSFSDWQINKQGNATILTKIMPFGQGSVEKTIRLVFSTPQSIYYAQTLSSFLTPTDSWSRGETIVLVAVNLDITLYNLQPNQYYFGYLIFNPAGQLVKSGSFSKTGFKLNSTQKSPLGKVLIANENITIDSSFNMSGIYTIQVISKAPYSLGFNSTSFLLYNFRIINPIINELSNERVKGSFSLSSDIDLSLFGRSFKGAYILIQDPSAEQRPYTKYFNVNDGIGITSLSIKNKIDHPGTTQNPNPPNLIYFTIFNNSTRGINLQSFGIRLKVFDKYSNATVNFAGFEPSYFDPGEVRSYILAFSLPLANPYIADYLKRNDNITTFIQSSLTKKSQELSFKYEEDVNAINPTLVHLERLKVWKLEFVVANKTYSSDWLLYDPTNKINNDVLWIIECNLNNSTASFDSSVLFNSVYQKYEIYGLAYTNDYQTSMQKIAYDTIFIKMQMLNNPSITVSNMQKIDVIIQISNLSNNTIANIDINVYNVDVLVNRTVITLNPHENKTIDISLDTPSNGSYLKIVSNKVNAIIGYVFIEKQEGIVEKIGGNLMNSFIQQYLIYIIVLLIVIISAFVSIKLVKRYKITKK